MYWDLEYSYTYADDIYAETFEYDKLMDLYDKIDSESEIEVYGVNLLDGGNVVVQLNDNLEYYRPYAEEYFGHTVYRSEIVDYILEQEI